MVQARQPAGAPTGGQFATKVHAEASAVIEQPRPIRHGSASVAAYLADRPGVAAEGAERVLEGTHFFPELPVTVGVVDDQARLAFLNGQCHALALAISERTGWPLVAVAASECVYDEDCGEDDSDGGCGCQYEHIGVRSPDGEIVDIRGWHTDEDWIEGSSDPADNEVSDLPGDRIEMIVFDDDSWRPPDMPVARAFVDAVLALPR